MGYEQEERGGEGGGAARPPPQWEQRQESRDTRQTEGDRWTTWLQLRPPAENLVGASQLEPFLYRKEQSFFSGTNPSDYQPHEGKD